MLEYYKYFIHRRAYNASKLTLRGHSDQTRVIRAYRLHPKTTMKWHKLTQIHGRPARMRWSLHHSHNLWTENTEFKQRFCMVLYCEKPIAIDIHTDVMTLTSLMSRRSSTAVA